MSDEDEKDNSTKKPAVEKPDEKLILDISKLNLDDESQKRQRFMSSHEANLMHYANQSPTIPPTIRPEVNDATKKVAKKVSFIQSCKNYAKKHPVRFGLLAALAVIGVAAFIAGTIMTGGALAGGVIAAGGIGGLIFGSGAALGGVLLVGGGITTAISLGLLNRAATEAEKKRKFQTLQKKRAENHSSTDIDRELKVKVKQKTSSSTLTSGVEGVVKKFNEGSKTVKANVRRVWKLGENQVQRLTEKKVDWADELKNSMKVISPYMSAYDNVKLNKAVEFNKTELQKREPIVRQFIENEKRRVDEMEEKFKSSNADRKEEDAFSKYRNYIINVHAILQERAQAFKGPHK